MSKTNFIINGPFEIVTLKKRKQKSQFQKIVTKETIRKFWDKIELKELKDKVGCYVYCIRAGGGYIPYYVGKTNRCFEKETSEASKINIYNEVLFLYGKGTPMIFLVVPKEIRKGANKLLKEKIAKVERFLIIQAKLRNNELLNVQHSMMPTFSIKGYYNSNNKGAKTRSEKDFSKMMNI